MREETRVHVRNVMAEIGYVLNRSAADMRGSNAGLTGLVINDLHNPFFTEFGSSLQMAPARAGAICCRPSGSTHVRRSHLPSRRAYSHI